jgi:hypothetical protein
MTVRDGPESADAIRDYQFFRARRSVIIPTVLNQAERYACEYLIGLRYGVEFGARRAKHGSRLQLLPRGWSQRPNADTASSACGKLVSRPSPGPACLNRFRHFCSSSPALASLNHTCRNLVPAFPQRSPPWLLTTAACGGLRST